MIEIKNLSKKYGDQIVLDDINVALHQGRIYGLVGPNGCGKTVFMKCICGFARPTSGSIVIEGKIVGKDTDFAQKTGVILETPGFLPNYSGIKNLLLLASISGKVTKETVILTLEKMGLDPSIKKKVKKYSLGMRQRLGIAQAIMEEPDYLILDEPLNGLDEQWSERVRDLLKQMKNAGKTILLASHNASDIKSLCDEVYTIVAGKLVKLQMQNASVSDDMKDGGN